MHLYLQQGDDKEQLTGNLQFKFEGFKVSTVETTVEIKPDYNKLFKDAYESSTVPKPIVTINGVAPTDRGAFFIDGSECDSWGEIKGSTAFPMGEAIKNEHDQLIDGGTASGIWLVDLCPSCTTCENVYRLQYETENLRMWINTLKDVNLMVSFPSADDVIADNNTLSKNRVTGGVGFAGDDWRAPGAVLWSDSNTKTEWDRCMIGGSTIALTPDDSFMRLRGLRLLKEYITTVHMWNYVVSQNNSSTEIQVAPEDTTGFVIQTKRALTSCGKQQKIRCTIEVDVVSGVVDPKKPQELTYPYVVNDDDSISLLTSDYKLSVFIPSATLEFKPFNNTVPDQCSPESVPVPGSTASQSTVWAVPSGALTVESTPDMAVSTYRDGVLTDLRNTKKIIKTGDIEANVAGTYIARVKLLPYIDMVLLNAYGTPVQVRGNTNSAASMKETETEEYLEYSFISGHKEYVRPGHVAGCANQPTEENYLQSKTAPTRSVAFKMLWNIKVTWEVETPGEAQPQKYAQTYIYTCNAPRIYYGAGMDGKIELKPLLPVSGGTTAIGGN